MEHIKSLIDSLPEFIFGAEDDDRDGQNGTPGSEGDPAGSENPAGEGDNGEGDPANDDSQEDGRTKALRAERKLKREAEAEARRLKAENEALKRKDMEEVDRIKAERDDALNQNTEHQTKLQKLIDGYRNNAVREAIRAEATKQKFIDVSDAIDGVDISSLSVDQDEDDPSQVTIDPKTVTNAVKKLATSKPHFINKGTNDGDPTGSSFGGTRQKGDRDSEGSLRMKYPSL